MLIDWFTVGAQFVNFIILALLMKRFLYRPILSAIAAREKQIADTLKEAEQKELKAENDLALLDQRQMSLQKHRSELLSQAALEVEEKRKLLTAAARDEVSALQARWRQELESGKESFRHQLALRVQSEVLAIVRQLLRDLADTDLETGVARQFIEKLRRLPKEEKASIVGALNGGSKPIIIRSASRMQERNQNEIEGAVKFELSNKATCRFEIAPELISGIELIARDHKVSWNIQSYLSSLETDLGEISGKEINAASQ